MLALVVAATLGVGNAGVTFALPDGNYVGVDADHRAFYGEHLAQQMKLLGAQIITTREIATMLGIERQRQLLGCSEGSCMTELAGALGATGVVLVDVAVDGRGTQVNLKLISATQGKTLGAWSQHVDSEDDVLGALSRGAQTLLMQSYRALGERPPDTLVDSFKSPLERAFWAPLAVGVAAAGAGLAVYFWAQSDWHALTVPSAHLLTDSQAMGYRNAGNLKEPLGVGLMIGGAVAVAAAMAMLVIGKMTASDVAALGFAPSPHGGAFVLSGAFP